MSRTVLTIEDDPAIRRGIVDSLRFAGFTVFEAGDGRTGLDMALGTSYDLLLLDLVLPGASGLDILRALRRVRPATPVIVLTARGDEADRVEGLRLGADDYVVKPFSVKELLARIEAVLRRSPARVTLREEASIPGGVVDFARRELRFGTERVELSEREVELLQYLLAHAGRAVPRDELLTNVWRISAQGLPTRTIDMQIARLREKLRDSGDEPQILLTVRGLGYMFAVAASPASATTDSSARSSSSPASDSEHAAKGASTSRKRGAP